MEEGRSAGESAERIMYSAERGVGNYGCYNADSLRNANAFAARARIEVDFVLTLSRAKSSVVDVGSISVMTGNVFSMLAKTSAHSLVRNVDLRARRSCLAYLAILIRTCSNVIHNFSYDRYRNAETPV